MPSDSIAGFLDRAQASRVLFPEQVEQLIRQPDIPQSDLRELCTYLLSRGVLTRFQADALRDGRGRDLNFAGYPLIDILGPCPGGTAYRALHPSLRTPLILRHLDPAALAPTDSIESIVQRARTYGTIAHPNLFPVVDAGICEGHGFAVLETQSDGSDLETLLPEVGGAMPGFLAAEYGWFVASALRSIHERGGWHGEVRPGLLHVGPILTRAKEGGVVRRRPAPNAVVKLMDTGLIPVAPPAAARLPSVAVLAYQSPERMDGIAYDSRGDLYGLGASLYFLLAGRPPISGETAVELLQKVRSVEPTSLASLRPTEPLELTGLVMSLLAKRPENRPRTAADVCETLAAFCRPGVLPAASSWTAVPQSVAVTVVPQGVSNKSAVKVPEPPAQPVLEHDPWGVDSNAFAAAQAASAADTAQPRRRQLTAKDKARSRMWLVVGLCLHLSAVGLIVAWAAGAFTSPPEPSTEPSRTTEPSRDKKADPPRQKQKNKKPAPERDAG